MDDQRINRIEHKLDALFDMNVKQSNVLERHSVLHEKNSADLEKHIKRTDALEDRMEQHAKVHDGKLEEALLPIKVAKFIVAISLGAGAIIALYSSIQNFIH